MPQSPVFSSRAVRAATGSGGRLGPRGVAAVRTAASPTWSVSAGASRASVSPLAAAGHALTCALGTESLRSQTLFSWRTVFLITGFVLFCFCTVDPSRLPPPTARLFPLALCRRVFLHPPTSMVSVVLGTLPPGQDRPCRLAPARPRLTPAFCPVSKVSARDCLRRRSKSQRTPTRALSWMLRSLLPRSWEGTLLPVTSPPLRLPLVHLWG